MLTNRRTNADDLEGLIIFFSSIHLSRSEYGQKEVLLYMVGSDDLHRVAALFDHSCRKDPS